MNANRLPAHYERISEAPDAIPSLRRFILDLAVRGKLVKHEPENEHVTDLLERRKIATSRDGPFELPSSWVWVNVASVAVARLGKMLDKTKNKGTTRKYLRNINVRWFDFDLSDIRKMRFEDSELPELALRLGDVLICEGGEPGRAAVWDGRQRDIYFQKAIHRVRFVNFVDSHFFVKALRVSADDGRLAEYFTGTGIKHFTGKGLADYLFPLPPFDEQHRIVAKVDELMEFCDRLDAMRSEREATRNRLATASLARLNAPSPDPTTFRNHAAFALENLTPLTTRPDQIKAIRQTILNLAIRGKLVEQDPNDEPASKLMKRIAGDRESFGTIGSLKKPKPLPPIDTANTPFDLPSGWAWVRFPEIGIFGRGKSKHRPRNDPVLYSDGKYPFIQTGDVARSHGSIKTYSSLYNDAGLAQSAMWPAGTLCITIAVNIADSGILAFDACFPDSVVGLVVHDSFKSARFFEYFIRTAKDDLQEFAPSTAQKNINLGILTEILIPLPPLAELHRIVTKIDDLMALCDRLEQSLATGDTARRRLFDAVLHDALAPSADLHDNTATTAVTPGKSQC